MLFKRKKCPLGHLFFCINGSVSGFLCRGLLAGGFVSLAQQHPHRSRDADGGISTGNETGHQRERKPPYGLNAQQEQQQDHDDGRDGCIDRTADGLRDADVAQLIKLIGTIVLAVLTNAVENNDGIVDGITNDGQHGRDEVIVDRDPENSIHGQNDQNIVDQSYDRAQAETNITETDGDVDQHQDDRYSYGDQRSTLHLGTDGGADAALLDQIAPEQFEVKHFGAITVLRKK